MRRIVVYAVIIAAATGAVVWGHAAARPGAPPGSAAAAFRQAQARCYAARHAYAIRAAAALAAGSNAPMLPLITQYGAHGPDTRAAKPGCPGGKRP